MSKNPRWDLVALVAVLMSMATLALIFKVELSSILAILGVVSTPIVTFLLYGKMQDIKEDTNEVKAQTNGNTTQLMQLLTSVVEHLKAQTAPLSLPVAAASPTIIEADINGSTG